MRGSQNQRDQAYDRRIRSLILRRWASLLFVFVLAVASGCVLCPFLERVQLAVATFLAPWGWAGGIFVGVIVATIAWMILRRFGVSLAMPIPNRLWITNPAAWPLGVVAFLLCLWLWNGVGGFQESDIGTLSSQAIGAILVLGIGRVVAWVVISAEEDVPEGFTRISGAEGDSAGLEDLAIRPERMIEWLQREEPIEDPQQDCFDMTPYARRIADLLRDKPLKTVALIGPYGCGKSSIVKMVQCYLAKDAGGQREASPTDSQDAVPFAGSDIIVAEVSGWGFREGTVVEHILDEIVEAMSRRIDCLEISTIPASYQRMLTGSGAWLHALCALVSSPAGCRDILQRIDGVLLRANMRVVAFLEDVDRNIREETFLNEVASLLENLKGLKNVSFVLAIGERYQGQDIAAKLGEQVEIVPPPARPPLLRVLRSFHEYCLKQYPGDIDTLSSQDRERRWSSEQSDLMDRMAEAGSIRRPMDATVGLLTSPRILKTSLRRTWFAWQRLHGEIDFTDLFVCSVLRAAVPEAFLLVNENISTLRALCHAIQTSEAEKRDDERRQRFASQLEGRGKNASWDSTAVALVVEFLFPGFRGKHPSFVAVDCPQGIRVDEPTDYWTRLNREEIDVNEIRDQQVLRAIDGWKAQRDSAVFQSHTMANATLAVEGFADKIEQFGERFDGKEVRDLASRLFAIILQRDVIGDAADCPGFIQLWRIASKSQCDSHGDWVIGEIRRALPVSLNFANRLYDYWRHTESHGHHRLTLELRARFVQSVRNVYQSNADVFVSALDPEYPWSIYHLVVYHGSQEGGGPGLDKEDWLWFGPVLLAAAFVKKEVVIPQISVLLTDYNYDPVANRRAEGVHRCVFNDSIAEKVFGQERMRELMQLLERNVDLAKHDAEIRLRVGCCNGRAQQWLRENPQQRTDSV